MTAADGTDAAAADASGATAEAGGAQPAPDPAARRPLVPGEIDGPDDPIVVNAGRPTRTLRVENTGDRPVQVGSHFHFAEVNAALAFDRAAAHGFRLDIAAGTAVRFEPGIALDVSLVAIGGRRIVAGLNGAVGGRLDAIPPESGAPGAGLPGNGSPAADGDEPPAAAQEDRRG